MMNALSTPLPINTERNPRRRMIGVAVTFINKAPAALVKVSSPDANGLSPKTTCSSIASRNGKAPIPIRKSPPPSVAALKVDFQQAHVDDRIVDSPRVDDVQRHAQAAADHQAHRDAGGHDAAAHRLEAEDHPRQAETGQQKTAQVERGDLFLAGIVDVPGDQPG